MASALSAASASATVVSVSTSAQLLSAIKAVNTRIYNNTLYNTTGIDVRFTASTAD